MLHFPFRSCKYKWWQCFYVSRFPWWESSSAEDQPPLWRSRTQSIGNGVLTSNFCKVVLSNRFRNIIDKSNGQTAANFHWLSLLRWIATWRWPSLIKISWPSQCYVLFPASLSPSQRWQLTGWFLPVWCLVLSWVTLQCGLAFFFALLEAKEWPSIRCPRIRCSRGLL